MSTLILRAAEALARTRRAVALTGAGISTESGIPPFRGKGGLWEKIDPMEVAHIEALRRNPEKVWRLLIMGMQTVLRQAQPNAAHKGLAALEARGHLQAVITQNVDGLHQRAGSREVIEFHGNFAWQRCMRCNQRVRTVDLDLATLPPHCACGGIFRPDCVFFGEMIPPQSLARSQQLAATCEVMLVVGTSATVQPAAVIPVLAKERGACIIEINPEPTPLSRRISDFFICGLAGEVMQALVGAIERLTESA